MSAAVRDKSVLDEKVVLGRAQDIPQPVTAPVEQENVQRRRTRFKRVLLASICLFYVFRVAHYFVYPGLVRDQAAHGSGHMAHKGGQKPKRPLTSDEAKELFLTIPDADSALGASRIYATHPHLAGSTEDFEDAKTILELFQTEFGIVAPPEPPIFPAGSKQSRAATLSASNLTAPAAWVDIYYPVMNTPLDHSVDIIGNDGVVTESLSLEEVADPRDPEAYKYKDAISTWHGLSRDGDVTGQLVYANYGTFEDYANLADTGANLTGKIALVRYGAVFRGLKIKRAQELGMSGVLVYSDPRDDGNVIVENGYEAYPAGPARNPTSVQRGSVQFLSAYPGDPTTPGTPAYEGANRTEGSNIPAIPSLPISWANAQRLLKELGGVDARKIDGMLSNSTIRLVNHVDTKVMPIWNTYAAIPGHIRDEVIMIGCHRDAWVMGAADPTSGTVSVREIVRGYGHLLRSGWKPLRTIVFASWDAEEYGLIGSTEFGEDFPEWIQKHVVAYLNVDVSVAGSTWRSGASPSLAPLIRANALKIPHPTDKNRTLWDARNDAGPFTKGEPDANFAAFLEKEKHAKRKASTTGIEPLGSGSDFTVFLQRLGVAAMDSGFGFSSTDAVYHYHSIYDSQHYQENFADPGFHRHVAVAKHLGLTALSISDAIILPLNTTQYAHELDTYLDRVEDLVSEASLGSSPDFRKLRRSIHQLQRVSANMDKEKVHAEKHFLKALHRLERHQRGSKGVRRHLRRAARWAKRTLGIHSEGCARRKGGRATHDQVWYDKLYDAVFAAEAGVQNEQDKQDKYLRQFIKAALRVRKINQQLIAFERGFISEDGIKDREWYRHLGVAPGKWLGYGATTLPAITEAITYEQDVKLAQQEADKLAQLVHNMAAGLKA